VLPSILFYEFFLDDSESFDAAYFSFLNINNLLKEFYGNSFGECANLRESLIKKT
jgi:hypothetical protein